ncbi:MAG: hypothetical protein ACI976_002298, partial [Aureispira sp.]
RTIEIKRHIFKSVQGMPKGYAERCKIRLPIIINTGIIWVRQVWKRMRMGKL